MTLCKGSVKHGNETWVRWERREDCAYRLIKMWNVAGSQYEHLFLLKEWLDLASHYGWFHMSATERLRSRGVRMVYFWDQWEDAVMTFRDSARAECKFR